MTGVQIRVLVEGADEALGRLRQAAEKTESPRELWDAIGLSLVTSTQRRFERGVAPDGSPWPVSIRVKLGGGKTLIDTLRLMPSITFVGSDTGVEVGTNVIYAAVHQFGATIVPVNAPKLHFQVGGKHRSVDEVTIPARPFLGLDQDDERDIMQTAEDFLAEALDERH